MQLLSLPDEVLLRICGEVGVAEKKSLALVCRKLRTITSDASLWTNCTVPAHSICAYGLGEILACPRLQALTQISLMGGDTNLQLGSSDVVRLFKYLSSTRCIRTLEIGQQDLSCVPGYPLARSFHSIRSLALPDCRLNSEQLTAILSKLQGKKLEVLNLSGNILQHVASTLLSRVAATTRQVNLSLTGLHPEQVLDIICSVGEGYTKALDLSCEDLSLVGPQQVSCLSRLRSLEINSSGAQLALIERLLEDLVLNSSRLVELDLGGIPLGDVESQLLGTAASKLTSIKLNFSWLTSAQIETILLKVSCASSALRLLTISGNFLLEVPAKLFSDALRQLERLEIYSGLSQAQMDLILEPLMKPQFGTLVLQKSSFQGRLLSRLVHHPNIELVETGYPEYSDENSCNYGDT